jgi:hypothetical protein
MHRLKLAKVEIGKVLLKEGFHLLVGGHFRNLSLHIV